MESENKHDLDQWLSRALHEHGNAEPRIGLQNRILANLAAERGSVAARRRWWWTLGMAATTAAVVMVLWFPHISNNRSKKHNFASNVTSTSQQTSEEKAHHVSLEPLPKRALHRQTLPRVAQVMELAESPKLSQFPAPQPLSEQERLLASYVRDFPQEAAMIAQAQARAEAERQLEELAADKTLQINSDQQER